MRDTESYVAPALVLATVVVAWLIGWWAGSAHLMPAISAVDLSNLEGAPKDYSSICADPSTREYADLCQQWRSAEAASLGASLAQLQVWVGLGGLAGLIATLLVSLRATGAAIESNATARELGETQVRAYVSWDGCRTGIASDGEKIMGLVLTPAIKNTGQSPAHLVSLYSHLKFISGDTRPAVEFQRQGTEVDHDLGAGNLFNFVDQWMSLADATDVVARSRRCYLMGWVEYRDIFWREGMSARELTFCFEVRLTALPTKELVQAGATFMILHSRPDYVVKPLP